MDETSATVTIKKVEDKKKKQEEEVEETIEIDEELGPEVKRGPFGVLLTKATQNKTVISVSWAIFIESIWFVMPVTVDWHIFYSCECLTFM